MPNSPPGTQPWRIAVIGGGAAGFFAALNIAEKNPQARITIFEAAHKPLQKVLISGGGRCNLTHACFDPARLIEYYPRGQKELRSVFARFQPADTITWFENRGLRLKTEADGRIFPHSDRSRDVIDLFLDQAEKYGIQLRTQQRVDSLAYQQGQFQLRSGGQTENFHACILATGYSPPGWKLAENLGHKILPPVPSLFPFKINAPILQGLQGISLEPVQGRLQVTAEGRTHKFEAEGALLITHTGLSGPVIYRLSAWGARALAEARYQAQLLLDLLPRSSEEALRQNLQGLFQEQAQRKLSNTSLEGIPQRLWHALLTASGLDLDAKAETVGKKTVNRLLENLKRLPLPVSGRSPSKEEFVSCGGVDLKAVDFKTMQSRLIPGLYFAGEILAIDGLTGGFNFQACWSEAWVMSEAFRI